MNQENSIIYRSDIHPYLEIIFKDGKKLLNTQNTNYSYGGLQEVLERGLNRIPMDNIDSVLVLGMGAGSVVESLRKKYNYQNQITGVEYDPVIIEIARKEFNLQEDLKVQIILDKAEDYIQKIENQFDLIIIDVFVDITVPKIFYSENFWHHIGTRVSDNGFVLFNAGIDLSEKQLKEFLDIIPDAFIYQKKLEVLESNTVFILQKVFS